uniref:Uncharacterized protein n=1 Tax=Tanacetum cinerariifolium TaxID=118510 RepID=A0A6L2KV20_TANCI|nr:hypothetical protein [Tanacetum cinerariifolium]
MTESPLVDSSFVVPVLSPGDDPIACLNKAMAFLTVVASSRFPLPIINLEPPRIQETNLLFRMKGSYCNKFRGDKVKVILVTVIRVMLLVLRETMQVDKQGLLNAIIVKDKDMLAKALEIGQILDEEQLAFLVDPGIPDGQAVQTIIPNNAVFRLRILIAVLMANISNYGSDVISENNEPITAELERYKELVKTFKQNLNIDLSSHEKMIDFQMDDMIKKKLALKEQVDSLEQNLSKQIKGNECLLQTFTAFKRESKEKEVKNIENEIELEKKIKELNDIIFKVGQSAHIVNMLTNPQGFYDNIHKQAPGYQNPFCLKKA